MAAAISVGGDGVVSVVLRESVEKGEEHRGSEKGQGLRGVADGVQGDEGKAASRRWRWWRVGGAAGESREGGGAQRE